MIAFEAEQQFVQSCIAALIPALHDWTNSGRRVTNNSGPVLQHSLWSGERRRIQHPSRLADVINKTKPDLVALQEVDVGVARSGRVHQARRLSELTNMAVRFGPTQHYEGGLFGNAVLTRLPITDVHIQPLPYTESTAERTTYPRAAVAVTIQLDEDNSLKFISTHFQHNVPEDRVAEAKAINSFFPD